MRKQKNKIEANIGDYVLITTNSNLSFSGKFVKKIRYEFFQGNNEKIIIQPSEKSLLWLMFDEGEIKQFKILVKECDNDNKKKD